MVARKAATKKKAKPKKKSDPVGRPSKYPGDKRAIAIVIKVGENGGGKLDMAVGLGVSHKALIDWLNSDSAFYKGDEFSEAVEDALSKSASRFVNGIQTHMVEEPGSAKVNVGVMKFIAQHKYGMVEKTVQETQGGLHVHVDKEDADL